MSGQHWDPGRYARNARFVADLGEPVVDLLAPQPGERILDLGCGAGALTERLAALGAEVVGVDASADQVAAARERGLDARVMDGTRLSFDEEFDAVFSNAAMHWMRDLAAVAAGVKRALRPGGRFVGEMGGAGNVAKVSEALMDALGRRGIDGEAVYPWVFPSPDAFGLVLQDAGFDVESAELIDRPTPLPGDVADWLHTFAEAFLNLLQAEDQPAFIEEVRAALAPKLLSAEGTWTVDYVRLRFAAVRTV